MATTDLERYRFPKRFVARVREMTVFSPIQGLRSAFTALRRGYFNPPTSPSLWDTTVHKDQARALYYNTFKGLEYGSYLARPVIDAVADYVRLPILTVRDDATDDIINRWVQDYWSSELWSAFRNSLREADTWIRIRRPFPNKLIDPDESTRGVSIDVFDTDRVTPYYHPGTGELIRVEIITDTYIEDEPFNPFELYATGIHSHGRNHEIVEIITPEYYMYYDATESRLLDAWTTNNEWGFVPMVQVFNDFDTAINGGMSDLEIVYPFFHAIHQVIEQTKQAHQNYANPKVKFKLQDFITFVRNNWPESFDGNSFTGKVSWRDKDVLFMEGTDDAGFIEAQMATGDSINLLEFLIDCVCIAAEVDEQALFRAKTEGTTASAVSERFKRKIERKRDNFAPYIQRLVQMALVVIGQSPKRPHVAWPDLELQDAIDRGTALNHVATASEVLNRSKVISRHTYRAAVRPYFPAMQDDADEEKAAQDEAQQEQDQIVQHTKNLAKAQPQRTAPPAPVAPTNGNGPGDNAGVNGVGRNLVTDTAPPPASG